MSGQPLVSVCLPVYNGERFLAQAIDSVLAQTVTDFELCIADDLSTDNSSKIIEEYARRDKRIVAWRNSNRKGLFANYNECMSRASGRYIKPFAQDDILEPNALAEMSNLLNENNDVSLVTCARKWIDDNGEILREIRPFAEDRIIAGKDVVLFNLIRCTNWVGEPVTGLFRRELIGDGFDRSFYHFGDIEYWFRIIQNSNYAYVNSVLCGFRRHAQSATSTNLKGLLFVLDIARLCQLNNNLLRELGESEAATARRVTEIVAMQLDHLVRVEGLTIEEVLRIPLPASEAGDLFENSGAMFVDPREKLYWLLRDVTMLLAEIDDLKCSSAAQREHLRNQINNLKRSTSWRITGPFRYMLRVGVRDSWVEGDRSKPVSSERAQVKSSDSPVSGFEKAICDALNYLDEKRTELHNSSIAWLAEREQLEREISRLQSSLSWKVSMPLRQFSKLLGGK